MKDCSIQVDRGADQSFLFRVFNDAVPPAPLNVAGKPVRAFIRASEAVPVLINKLLLPVPPGTGSNGEMYLALTRTESRLIPLGNRLQIEIKLFDDDKEIIIGRGRVTGVGGITLDT
jgi:hypothetical protein